MSIEKISNINNQIFDLKIIDNNQQFIKNNEYKLKILSQTNDGSIIGIINNQLIKLPKLSTNLPNEVILKFIEQNHNGEYIFKLISKNNINFLVTKLSYEDIIKELNINIKSPFLSNVLDSHFKYNLPLNPQNIEKIIKLINNLQSLENTNTVNHFLEHSNLQLLSDSITLLDYLKLPINQESLNITKYLLENLSNKNIDIFFKNDFYLKFLNHLQKIVLEIEKNNLQITPKFKNLINIFLKHDTNLKNITFETLSNPNNLLKNLKESINLNSKIVQNLFEILDELKNFRNELTNNSNNFNNFNKDFFTYFDELHNLTIDLLKEHSLIEFYSLFSGYNITKLTLDDENNNALIIFKENKKNYVFDIFLNLSKLENIKINIMSLNNNFFVNIFTKNKQIKDFLEEYVQKYDLQNKIPKLNKILIFIGKDSDFQLPTFKDEFLFKNKYEFKKININV